MEKEVLLGHLRAFLMFDFKFEYTNWYPDEPNGHAGENCLAILGALSQYTFMTWNDAPCNYDYSFVCEKPLQEASIERLWIGLNDLVTAFEPKQAVLHSS